MFTKKDLLNGDVIKKRNGNVEILVLPLGTLVCDDGHYNIADDIKDDLTSKVGAEYDIVAVRRPVNTKDCTFSAFRYEKGELVYDRERDTTPLYNGKVVCIDKNDTVCYTVGKIYQFKNGVIMTDEDHKLPVGFAIHSFEDWTKISSAKWLEIKE